MMRSMYSAVAGLRIHQTKMDVIGNNISNVNTIGFKSARVTFKEVFSQTISGATGSTAPQKGGTNPYQIGLGSTLQSIDVQMGSGTPQRTDGAYDLFIDGEGFFVVSDSSGTYFTRAGAFRLDVDGYLTDPNGLFVNGW
ncbi:MAG: flagellar hook-basal body complex protein, partial [Clostridiales bacterium]|nr:flagellar hook-basal body complex protein [Clostridiales bacterium]